MRMCSRESRFAAPRRSLRLALLAAVLALAGCKSRDGGGMFSSGPSRTADPLVVGPGRIPKQNLPVPGRDLAGGNRSDPLLGSPTGRTADRQVARREGAVSSENATLDTLKTLRAPLPDEERPAV